MDRAAAAKRFENLVRELGESYALLRTLLLTLPIPMRLVGRQADAPVEAIRGLSRAWELISWEPLDTLLAKQLRLMITEWLTAYELAVAASENGPAVWRIHGIETALARFGISAKYVARRLK